MLARKLLDNKKLLILGSIALLLVVLSIWAFTGIDQQKTKIVDNEIRIDSNAGTINGTYQKTPRISNLVAKKGESVSYQSPEISTDQKESNAVILEWDQNGDSGLSMEARTYNGEVWTDWIDSLDEDSNAKSSSGNASTLILAKKIDKVQYRFKLDGKTSKSASINLSQSKLTAIDSNQGPNGEKTFKQKVKNLFGLENRANAISSGPRVISRAEWGSPQPSSSPDWQPSYYKLERANIHHTVSTETPNSYAAVRAIWRYHTYSNGWGDIGYNFIVDSQGRIFQGRYYSHSYAFNNKKEVEGAHTYGNNKGTIGIAAIGNYQTKSPTSSTLNSISSLIAYKFAPYGLNPYATSVFGGSTIIGHRDFGSTACPGNKLHAKLSYIRYLVSRKVGRYSLYYNYDYRFAGQQLYKDGQPVDREELLKPGDDVELAINLRNYGMVSWRNTESGEGQLVKLGTSRARDRSSAFSSDQWLSARRPGSFTGKVSGGTVDTSATLIKFGEVAQFRFKLDIPELSSSINVSSRTINEYFRPVIDGKLWFPRDMGIFQPLNVELAGTYRWSFDGQAIYSDPSMSQQLDFDNLQAGTRYYVILKARNNGTATWEQNNLKLGTSRPNDRLSILYDSTWLSANRAARIAESTVQPGEVATFGFWIDAPTVPGEYKEYFRPVADGITWLNDLGQFYKLNVN